MVELVFFSDKGEKLGSVQSVYVPTHSELDFVRMYDPVSKKVLDWQVGKRISHPMFKKDGGILEEVWVYLHSPEEVPFC